ncbi:hypothetical protein [Brevibacillus sp. H7]|uniref:hypothetical protein n=1 Tax=Brevibacillus sp. H7 TaxID=3349138 RepID=UPI00380A1DE0
MCVLCGEYVMNVHWTDRKSDRNEDNRKVVAGENQRSRVRDRRHRSRLTNQILRYYGLRVEDWTGSKYVLYDKKGRSVIVQDLGGLWPAAEKLINRPLDPLDPALLETLASGKSGAGRDSR